MRLIYKNMKGLSEFDADSLLANNRIIYLEGVIKTRKAMDFAKKIAYLSKNNIDEPIKVFINSAGGELSAGMMIYDIIQDSPVKLPLYCLEEAYSMGAIIFASGKDGRYILPHSKMMIHEPLLSKSLGGNSSYVKDVAIEMLKVNEKTNAMLAKCTGQSIEKINEATRESRIFTAEEAVNFGLADKVMSYREMLEA